MNVTLVDDDEYNQMRIKETIERFLGAHVKVFDNIMDAALKSNSPDYLVIDISTVCPILAAYTAYSPICVFLDRHPGCKVVINSAIAHPDEVVEAVKEYMPDADVVAVKNYCDPYAVLRAMGVENVDER